MINFLIEVESVSGYCSCGYMPGDTFTCQGMNTPNSSFCGGAYMALFPMQVALYGGARFDFEANPKSKTGLACPDNGYVVFSITQTII
jgi:uncharacterized repeat protein (TIGR04076 family)